MIPTMDRPVTLFDLDGVLSRQDTMATLVTQRLRRHPVRLVAAVPLVLLARMAPPHGRLKPAINRKLVALALYGVTELEYRGLADSTAQRLAARPTNVPAQALSEFEAARGLGRVIVTTGTERHLAAAYLHAIGIGSVELQASALTFSGNGVRLIQHNVGSPRDSFAQRVSNFRQQRSHRCRDLQLASEWPGGAGEPQQPVPAHHGTTADRGCDQQVA